jgi:hypothetical protein
VNGCNWAESGLSVFGSTSAQSGFSKRPISHPLT